MRTVTSESKSFTIMMAVQRLLICLRVRVKQVPNLLELTIVWPRHGIYRYHLWEDPGLTSVKR